MWYFVTEASLWCRMRTMIHSAEEFVNLRSQNDERATHDEAPEAVWLEIIRLYPELREWVVHNRTVPLSILRILAADPDPRVRIAVAMKRKCSPDILELLARDTDETVRARVAWNRQTPAHILQSMKQDPSPLVADALMARSGD
jgi:hypothetical protein